MCGRDVIMNELKRESRSVEEAIENRRLDFSALYMALGDLHALVESHPEAAGSRTVRVLKGVLLGREHSSQKQAYFLYKEAADAIAAVVIRNPERPSVAEQGLGALGKAVSAANGAPHRAASEALGSLPLSVRGPNVDAERETDIPLLPWREVLERAGAKPACSPTGFGRSFVTPVQGGKGLLVVKMARTDTPVESLAEEAAWMEYFASGKGRLPAGCVAPIPLKPCGGYVFRLKDPPAVPSSETGLHPERYAIAFNAPADYFTYPNLHASENRLDELRFKEVMFRNALILGDLSSAGIVHTAAIPLFHNRVQTARRPDRGLYEWPRGGRLDRWLHSCRYPNFGASGVRDFEHFLSFRDSTRKLYQHMGSHLLSLLLVTGSYYRNRDPRRVGFDAEGKPVDARGLFNRDGLREIVEGVFSNYYRGFVGEERPSGFSFDFDGLACRMIEEMGVDRHMEEILRAADQNDMTQDAFEEFLDARGFHQGEIQGAAKGAGDIVIHTGPHLGGFNDRISLPELIEFVASAAALCIAGRYRKERLGEGLRQTG